METVYRVEHKTRRSGPYTVANDLYYCDDHCEDCRKCEFYMRMRDLSDRMQDAADLMGNQPLPSRDGITDMIEDEELFGFASREQMRDWFDENVMKDLRANGFVVRTYRAKHVRHGSRQLVFIPA